MRNLPALVLIAALLLSAAPPAHAQGTDAEPESGAVVCPPSLHADAGDCAPLGPSQTLADLASRGLSYPLRPLPAYKPPADLTRLDFRYFKADENTPLPVSLTPGGTPGWELPGGNLVYISYINRAETNGGVYYQRRGAWDWIPGRGQRVSYSQFQGLLFSSTPRNQFGWALQTIPARTRPSFDAPLAGVTYYRYNVIQIFDMVEAEGVRWFLIGPDRWLDGRHVGRVIPATQPPPGVQNGRWIDINLEEQTLAVYEDNRLVFATLIASGTDPYWTRPGLFQIYQKIESTPMSGAFEADRSDYYYLEDVPWTMYFDQKRALHGAYWRTLFGYEQSHGCVNLSVGDAHWLYLWAREGDWVYVYDPSGRTPTDDSYYSEGGA